MLLEKNVAPDSSKRYKGSRTAILEVMNSQSAAPATDHVPAKVRRQASVRLRNIPSRDRAFRRRQQNNNTAAFPESRLEKSERRLFMVCTAGCVAVVSAFVGYITAYSALTCTSIQNSHARQTLSVLRSRNEQLRVDFAQMQSPQRIAAEAAIAGLVQHTGPVDYISPRIQSTYTAKLPDSVTASSDTAETNGRAITSKVAYSADSAFGTTTDSN